MSQPEVTADEFRRVMGGFATGVTVVTTIYHGQPYGLTVNALCSVSLDPPLLAISLQRTSRTLTMIERSGRFAVNVLSAEQRALAERFARKDLRDKPFNAVGYHRGARVRDVVLFDEALARIECVVASEYPGGDHVVVLGKVVALDQDDTVGTAAPLLFYHSAFRTLDVDSMVKAV